MHPERRAELALVKRTEQADAFREKLDHVGGRVGYGWALIMVDHDKSRRYEDLAPGLSHAEASRVRNERLAAAGARCRYSMLVQKSYDPYALSQSEIARNRHEKERTGWYEEEDLD